MEWQLVAVSVLLAVAAAYLARTAWRTWFGRAGCGSGCGSCAKPAPDEPNRRRIGLPQV